MVKLVSQVLILIGLEDPHEVVVVYKVQYKSDDIVVQELEGNAREHVSTKSYKESWVKFLVRQ